MQLAGLLRMWLPRFKFSRETLSAVISATLTTKKLEQASGQVTSAVGDSLSDGLRGSGMSMPTIGALIDVSAGLESHVDFVLIRLVRRRFCSTSAHCQLPADQLTPGQVDRRSARSSRTTRCHAAKTPSRSSGLDSTHQTRASLVRSSRRCARPGTSSSWRFASIRHAGKRARYTFTFSVPQISELIALRS